MADRKKKCEECEEGAPLWMLTYGDMVTLLLTFFVMLFTVAKIEGREFRLVLSAFKGSLGLFEGGQTLKKGRLEDMGMNLEKMPSDTAGKTLSKALKEATSIFEPELKTKRVKIQQQERGIVISLVGDSFFAPGSARLTGETQRALTKVANLFRSLNSLIKIEGHADENPVARGKAGEHFETNWELASQRAINALRYLHEREDVEPAKMSAVSYGKFRPVSSSSTMEGRALNRRIDIVILTGKKYERDYKDTNLPGKLTPNTEFSVP